MPEPFRWSQLALEVREARRLYEVALHHLEKVEPGRDARLAEEGVSWSLERYRLALCELEAAAANERRSLPAGAPEKRAGFASVPLGKPDGQNPV